MPYHKSSRRTLSPDLEDVPDAAVASVSDFSEVHAALDAVLDGSRPEAVAKQHARGMLTARERVSLLIDPGATFREYGALARPVHPDLHAPADGVVIGVGAIHGRPASIVSY